jgi:hypothetical protein
LDVRSLPNNGGDNDLSESPGTLFEFAKDRTKELPGESLAGSFPLLS